MVLVVLIGGGGIGGAAPRPGWQIDRVAGWMDDGWGMDGRWMDGGWMDGGREGGIVYMTTIHGSCADPKGPTSSPALSVILEGAHGGARASAAAAVESARSSGDGEDDEVVTAEGAAGMGGGNGRRVL